MQGLFYFFVALLLLIFNIRSEIEGNMKNWTYYYDRGIHLKDKGQLEESAEHHLKVFEVAPDLTMPEAWHNAGAALLRVNQATEAKPYLERALVEYDVCIIHTFFEFFLNPKILYFLRNIKPMKCCK